MRSLRDVVISSIKTMQDGQIQVTFANKQGVCFKSAADVVAMAKAAVASITPGEKAAIALATTAKPSDLIGVDVVERLRQVLGV